MLAKLENGADVVVVMAKYPTPGTVKTRLAAAVGDLHACTLYRAFLVDLDRTLRSEQWGLVWAMAPAGSRLNDVIGREALGYLDQRGAGLASRMLHCFSDLFAAGAGRVVMVGADVPHLGADTVKRSLAALQHSDVVVVPSRDGGYCLVAMRALHDVFSEVEMSTEKVLDETRAACQLQGLSLHELATSFDIDDLNDVRLLARHISRDCAMPATAEVLTDWRRRGLLDLNP